MANRNLAYIVKNQKPLVLALEDTVQNACRFMRERGAGSVLVIDDRQHLRGIFTGRDAVRLLAEGSDATVTTLVQAMTPDPITITPDSRAIDALRKMSDGGFRHLPVVDNGKIWGIVARSDFKGMEIDPARRGRPPMGMHPLMRLHLGCLRKAARTAPSASSSCRQTDSA
jgi:CBS domain-containing protein